MPEDEITGACTGDARPPQGEIPIQGDATPLEAGWAPATQADLEALAEQLQRQDREGEWRMENGASRIEESGDP